MKKYFLSLFMLVFLASPVFVQAHCEIPCGIFGDKMRIDMIDEHITTIEKSMRLINELSAAETVNYNQLVRWIVNKEKHAEEIQHIVNQYFLAQRIKPTATEDKAAYEKYVRELSLLHEMLVYAMKAKQTTDMQPIEKLRALLKSFSESYFGPEEMKHLEEHKQHKH